MKKETAELLQKLLEQERFEFTSVETGLEFNYDLTDEEVKELVQLEYGNSITQPVNELFEVIVKKMVKIAVDSAKEEPSGN